MAGCPIAVPDSDPAQGEWMTTQEAADRCGFTRPFVEGLLNSGAYPGQVSLKPGEPRKVLATEFHALMAQASSKAPMTLAEARQAVDVSRLNGAATVPTAERNQSRSRARALAIKWGLD